MKGVPPWAYIKGEVPARPVNVRFFT